MLRKEARFDLAHRVQSKTGAPLGEAFQFTSGLYFRGKLAYCRAFGAPGDAFVITPGDGLVSPDIHVTARDIARWAKIDIATESLKFQRPLRRDGNALRAAIGADVEVVLLGSVASGKYTTLLLELFGERLVFPTSFVGRGDMSRGGLMLRCVRSGEELVYAPVKGAVVHGKRAEKLQPLPRSVRAA